MLTEENGNIEKNHFLGNVLIKRFKYLLRFWWLFILVGIISGLGGIWYASNKKILYKSHLTFALDEGSKNSMANVLSLASQLGFSLNEANDIFGGDNINEIIKSRRIVEQILLSVDTFHTKPYTLIEYLLDIDGSKKNSRILKNVHFPVGQDRSTFTYQQDSILYHTYLSFANENIVTDRPDRKLSLFEINVTSPDEKFTKDFTDRLVAEADSFYIQVRTKKAKQTLDILEDRVASMKGNLNNSISKKSEIQDVNVNPAFSSGQAPVLKQQANIQVYSAAYAELFKNLEFARFNYLNEIPLMQIIDKADYPMEKIKFGKLKGALLFSILAELLLLCFLALKKIFSNQS